MSNNLPVRCLMEGMKENWAEAATPETSIIFGIIRFYELIRQRTDAALGAFDLTPAAFEVLVTLRSQPEPRQMTPTELYRSVLLSSGGTTKVLIHLEKRGLTERVPNPNDGRSKLVRLTPAGAQLAQTAMAAVMVEDKKHFSAYATPAEVSGLKDAVLEMIGKVESGT